MAVCERLGGEIVSCDSVQVYRGFGDFIGCAKPSAAERRGVAHHAIDVADADEPFDAQRFRELAGAAIAEIRSRGRLPVVCGGTGTYLRSLRWGLMPAPPANEPLRAGLLAEEARQPGVLYARLREVDPETAQRTEPNNLVRVVRALEIHRQDRRDAERPQGPPWLCPRGGGDAGHGADLARRAVARPYRGAHPPHARAGPARRGGGPPGRRHVAPAAPGHASRSSSAREAGRWRRAARRRREDGLAERMPPLGASAGLRAPPARAWLRREQEVEALAVTSLEQAVGSCLAPLSV